MELPAGSAEVDSSELLEMMRQAVLFENTELLGDLLKENQWAASKFDRFGRTLLMLAAHNGRCRALEEVLGSTPGFVDVQGGGGKTALHFAIEAGQVAAAKMLLTAGADPTIRDASSHCSLEAAQMAGHAQLTQLLIDAIQTENEKLNSDRKRLMRACVDGDAAEALALSAACPFRQLDTLFNGREAEDQPVLFVACQNGHFEVVSALLQYKDRHAVVHPVTKDTVIHAAVAGRSAPAFALILKTFPELAGQVNADGSSVLHWIAHTGDLQLAKTFFEFEFDDMYLKTFETHQGHVYKFCIDANEMDGQCRTALYSAVADGHQAMAECLLDFEIEFSDGSRGCPFQIDVYCIRGRTPLMVAAFNQSAGLIQLLLQKGADVNLPLGVLEETEQQLESARCVGSGALAEAVRSGALHVVQLLLQSGAVDTDNRALSIAALNNNDKIVRVLLCRLAHPDAEYKVNKRNVDVGQVRVGESLLPSALCPSKGASLSWASASLAQVQADWFVAAALQVNPRLKTTRLALAAITRVDLSSNRLTVFPSVLLQMPSLRVLNLSQNQLTTVEPPSYAIASHAIETLSLAHNRIEQLSSQLLAALPSLASLDLSYNRISMLSEHIWLCPVLKELNLSHNSLTALPSLNNRPRLSRTANLAHMADGLNLQNDADDNLQGGERQELWRANVWMGEIPLCKVEEEASDVPLSSSGTLTTLNLSANKLSIFPSCLACVCPRLLSLNLSFNLLSHLAPVQCIPGHLRSLDVSHNRLRELFSDGMPHLAACQAPPLPAEVRYAQLPGRRRSPSKRDTRSRSKSAVRSQRSLSVSRNPDAVRGGPKSPAAASARAWEEEACAHKRHDSLQWCKTLNVSGNELTSLVLWRESEPLLPALSVFDASDNNLSEIPRHIGHLTGLAVLNLNSNAPLETLPSEVGLLSRLWSLSLKGCRLKEPLHSMVNLEQCKTVQIVAFLKSILEQAKALRHLKLFFVGAHGSGKSMLWEAVRAETTAKKSPQQFDSVRFAEYKIEGKKPGKGEQPLATVGFEAVDFTCEKRELNAVQTYAMCRKAVYVVVFRISDGEDGLEQAEKMLIAIQARAPNACAVVVGTHRDQVTQNADRFPPTFLEDLESRCRQRWQVADADKKGLPKVIDVALISAKSKTATKNLAQTILRAAWEARIGRERVLDTPVPSTYVNMIKVIRAMNIERREGDLAVHALMSADELRGRVEERMRGKGGASFRDEGEFNAAVSFLHDSGEIVHYEDASLRSVYCTDPVYLLHAICACLRVRPPNGPAAILMPENLGTVFKTFQCDKPIHRAFIMNILHKFEVALVCSSPVLLLPSHLPDEYALRADTISKSVRVLVRGANWRIRTSGTGGPDLAPVHSQLSRTGNSLHSNFDANSDTSSNIVVQFSYGRAIRYRRCISLAYLPAGFWPRIITRMMGDASICRAVSQLFVCNDGTAVPQLSKTLRKMAPEWMLWETGIEIQVKGHAIFILKQFLPNAEVRDIHYGKSDWYLQHEGQWRLASLEKRPVVEMLVATLNMPVVVDGSHRIEMCVDEAAAAALLALVTELLDTLLEDWYPALGTRFVHSSEGDLLVQRIIPCMHCASDEIKARENQPHDDSAIQAAHRTSSAGTRSKTLQDLRHNVRYYAYTIEECIAATRKGGWLTCEKHGAVPTRSLAPDLHFADLEGSLLITSDSLKTNRLLGRGAFGFVFRSTARNKATGECVDAAIKMLEPVDPGQGRGSAAAAYRAAVAKWERDEAENACKAYTTCRQELFLLVRMRHISVLALLGVSFTPLALVVELAPLGALDQLLASYRKSGCRLGLSVIADVINQVAKALEYLHQQFIIYRDLKSENVLAWRFPPPFSNLSEVLVKLGDYGISRSILPSGGAKGFGGTEGFMAPEIVRFNGEEEYTQQVDSFSFGMFVYELLSLRLPFDGEDHIKERLLDGARPFLLPHELLVPSLMLDMMVLCWRHSPQLRPTSSQLVSLVAAPEFGRVLDVVQLPTLKSAPHQAAAIVTSDEWDDDELDAELCLLSAGQSFNVLSCTQFGWTEHRTSKLERAYSWIIRGPDASTVWLIAETGALAAFGSSLQYTASAELPVEQSIVCSPCVLNSDLLCLPTTSALSLIRLDESLYISMQTSLPIHSTIKVIIGLTSDDSRQVWTGHDDGIIQAHTISNDDRFCFASSLSHPEAQGPIDLLETDSACRHVWAASSQASRVFCWDVARRITLSILNVRKVAPGWEAVTPSVQESLQSSTVSALAVLDRASASTLFIGTSAGVLIAANSITLQPVLACRPYEAPLTYLLIVESKSETDTSKRHHSVHTSDSMGSLGWMRDRVSETVDRLRGTGGGGSTTSMSKSPAVLISFGSRYRSATERICGVDASPANLKRRSIRPDDPTAIIWRAEDWLP